MTSDLQHEFTVEGKQPRGFRGRYALDTRFPRTKHCAYCGKVFYKSKQFSWKQWEKQRFCDAVCAWAPRRKVVRQGKQGRWFVATRDHQLVAYSRVVMEAHLGRHLDSEEIVHHINGDHTDDRLENLQLTTKAEHAFIHGIPGNNRKLTAQDVVEIRAATGHVSQLELGRRYGVSGLTIARVQRREIYREIAA